MQKRWEMHVFVLSLFSLLSFVCILKPLFFLFFSFYSNTKPKHFFFYSRRDNSSLQNNCRWFLILFLFSFFAFCSNNKIRCEHVLWLPCTTGFDLSLSLPHPWFHRKWEKKMCSWYDCFDCILFYTYLYIFLSFFLYLFYVRGNIIHNKICTNPNTAPNPFGMAMKKSCTANPYVPQKIPFNVLVIMVRTCMVLLFRSRNTVRIVDNGAP